MPKGVFSGLLICVSGAFDGMSQAEVKNAVTKNGGKISSTCTKTTDYVLAAALGTGKAGRAQDLGIPVCGQEWLEACIADGVISTKASHYHYKPDGGKATAKPTARARTGKDDDDDDDGGDDDGDDDDEDDKPKKKKKPAAAAAAAKKKKKKMSDSDGEADSGEDDDDDKPKGGKKRKAATSSGGSGVFDGLTFAVSGRMSRSQAEVKTLLAKHGGTLAGSVTAAVTHCLAEDLGSGKTMTAARSGRPVVRESWLDDCIAEGKVLKDDKYYVANSPSGNIGKNGGAGGGKGKGKGSDDDDGDDDDEPPKKKAKKNAKKKDDDDDDDGDDDDAPAKSKKSAAKSTASGGDSGLKKVVMKGAVAVDDGCPGARDGHVLQEKGGLIWDALLNQTNIAQNNNKFYVIQIIEMDKGGSYYVWNRWGRVGAKGQNKYEPHGSNLEAAKRSFRSKFREKTKNDWDTVSARPDSFRPASGKYTVLLRDISLADNAQDDDGGAAGDDGEDDEDKKKSTKPKQKVESALDARVQSLVSLISDKSMMEKQMVEIGFDPKRMPLGKLSKDTINKGYSVLKKIAEQLEGKANNATLVDLSSQFYTLVPHNFGMTVPPVIRTQAMLKDKLAMVEALADIEIATKLLGKEGKGDNDIHPIDAAYLKLKCKMTAVNKTGDEAPEFELVKKYVANTHAATHTAYALEVEEVFRLGRDGEDERFAEWKDNENRQLLWHGSRLTNFVGILSQGLRIAPPEAPVTGYMFGKGVYFADMVSKSANYCCTNRDSNTGLMLLCEVALGKERPLYAADYYADQLPAGSHSTKGVGTTHPDPAGAEQLSNGCKVPCGKGVTYNSPYPTSLLYNEFIVYDTKQVTMRYLVRMKFHYKS